MVFIYITQSGKDTKKVIISKTLLKTVIDLLLVTFHLPSPGTSLPCLSHMFLCKIEIGIVFRLYVN